MLNCSIRQVQNIARILDRFPAATNIGGNCFYLCRILTSICIVMNCMLSTAQVDTMILRWDGNVLQFDDFKGIADSEDQINDANSSVGISLEYENRKGHLSVRVHAEFWKEESWMTRQDSNLLRHEQLHFDIAELFARRLRKVFSEKVYDTREEAIEFIETNFKRIIEEENMYHELYDIETRHGLDIGRQSQWNMRVHKELVNLVIYKDVYYLVQE